MRSSHPSSTPATLHHKVRPTGIEQGGEDPYYNHIYNHHRNYGEPNSTPTAINTLIPGTTTDEQYTLATTVTLQRKQEVDTLSRCCCNTPRGNTVPGSHNNKCKLSLATFEKPQGRQIEQLSLT